jgi:hypothetical protein
VLFFTGYCHFPGSDGKKRDLAEPIGNTGQFWPIAGNTPKTFFHRVLPQGVDPADFEPCLAVFAGLFKWPLRTA